jgi:hypothetical protein
MSSASGPRTMAVATLRFGAYSFLRCLCSILTVLSETVKRILNLPEGTNIIWRSHDDSIAQRINIDQARHEKNHHQGHEKRRVTSTDESQRDKPLAGS